MLKWLPIFVLLLCSACNTDTQKDTVLSFASMGYDKPGLFIFRVSQSDSNNTIQHIDTIGLFCSDIPFSTNKGQNYCQWQILTLDDSFKYTIAENQSHNSYEGIEACDTELFIHPARDIYRILQFCPYPYFKNNPIVHTWNWSFDIGANWAIADLYPIVSLENFQINYAVKDTATINTKFGELFCYTVKAVSKSKFGVSYAFYVLNNNYGIVRSSIKTINNHTLEFELISKIPSIEGLECNKYFLGDYDRWVKKRSEDFQSFLYKRK